MHGQDLLIGLVGINKGIVYLIHLSVAILELCESICFELRLERINLGVHICLERTNLGVRFLKLGVRFFILGVDILVGEMRNAKNSSGARNSRAEK